MVEIKFEILRDSDPDIHHIIVNDISDQDSHCFKSKTSTWYCKLNNEEVYNLLKECRFKEIKQHLSMFTYTFDLQPPQLGYDVHVMFGNEEGARKGVGIAFQFNSGLWARPYSISQLAQSLKKVIQAEKNDQLEYLLPTSPQHLGFGLFARVTDEENLIKAEIEKAISQSIELKTRAESAALAGLDKDNLLSFFSFPEGVKVACKQYLVYFSQFLLDLGIEAETEITEVAGETLFKVIPSNKNEALDKIREALTAYLNAPAFADSYFQSNSNSDVAIMQWHANVMHLKSQLMLAKSVLQMKDATIEMLSLSNYQYQQLALKNSQADNAQNEEDIIKGIVSVKHYEGKGFSVNLPEIFRRLKRRFGGK